MAKSSIDISDSWVLVSSNKASYTVRKVGEGILLVNDAQSEVGALKVNNFSGRVQLLQTSAVNTYMKVTKPSTWTVDVDES